MEQKFQYNISVNDNTDKYISKIDRAMSSFLNSFKNKISNLLTNQDGLNNVIEKNINLTVNQINANSYLTETIKNNIDNNKQLNNVNKLNIVSNKNVKTSIDGIADANTKLINTLTNKNNINKSTNVNKQIVDNKKLKTSIDNISESTKDITGINIIKDIKVPKVTKEYKEPKESKKFKEPIISKISKELIILKEPKESKKPIILKEPTVSKRFEKSIVLKVPKESIILKEPKKTKEPTVSKKFKEPIVPKISKELKILKESKELEIIKEPIILKEPKESKKSKEPIVLREPKGPKDLKNSQKFTVSKISEGSKESTISKIFEGFKEFIVSKILKKPIIPKVSKEPIIPKVFKESKELEIIKEPIILKEPKESKKSKEPIIPKVFKESKELEIIKEPIILKEPKESKKSKESIIPKVLKESKELEIIKEPIILKEPKESKIPKILKESKESKIPKILKESKELEIIKEPIILKEPKESKKSKESIVPKISKEPIIPKVLKESKELEIIKEPIILKEPKESKKSKESIVPKISKEPIIPKVLKESKELEIIKESIILKEPKKSKEYKEPIIPKVSKKSEKSIIPKVSKKSEEPIIPDEQPKDTKKSISLLANYFLFAKNGYDEIKDKLKDIIDYKNKDNETQKKSNGLLSVGHRLHTKIGGIGTTIFSRWKGILALISIKEIVEEYLQFEQKVSELNTVISGNQLALTKSIELSLKFNKALGYSREEILDLAKQGLALNIIENGAKAFGNWAESTIYLAKATGESLQSVGDMNAQLVKVSGVKSERLRGFGYALKFIADNSMMTSDELMSLNSKISTIFTTLDAGVVKEKDVILTELNVLRAVLKDAGGDFSSIEDTIKSALDPTDLEAQSKAIQSLGVAMGNIYSYSDIESLLKNRDFLTLGKAITNNFANYTSDMGMYYQQITNWGQETFLALQKVGKTPAAWEKFDVTKMLDDKKLKEAAEKTQSEFYSVLNEMKNNFSMIMYEIGKGFYSIGKGPFKYVSKLIEKFFNWINNDGKPILANFFKSIQKIGEPVGRIFKSLINILPKILVPMVKLIDKGLSLLVTKLDKITPLLDKKIEELFAWIDGPGKPVIDKFITTIVNVGNIIGSLFTRIYNFLMEGNPPLIVRGFILLEKGVINLIKIFEKVSDWYSKLSDQSKEYVVAIGAVTFGLWNFGLLTPIVIAGLWSFHKVFSFVFKTGFSLIWLGVKKIAWNGIKFLVTGLWWAGAQAGLMMKALGARLLMGLAWMGKTVIPSLIAMATRISTLVAGMSMATVGIIGAFVAVAAAATTAGAVLINNYYDPQIKRQKNLIKLYKEQGDELERQMTAKATRVNMETLQSYSYIESSKDMDKFIKKLVETKTKGYITSEGIISEDLGLLKSERKGTQLFLNKALENAAKTSGMPIETILTKFSEASKKESEKPKEEDILKGPTGKVYDMSKSSKDLVDSSLNLESATDSMKSLKEMEKNFKLEISSPTVNLPAIQPQINVPENLLPTQPDLIDKSMQVGVQPQLMTKEKPFEIIDLTSNSQTIPDIISSPIANEKSPYDINTPNNIIPTQNIIEYTKPVETPQVAPSPQIINNNLTNNELLQLLKTQSTYLASINNNLKSLDDQEIINAVNTQSRMLDEINRTLKSLKSTGINRTIANKILGQ